MYKLPDFPMKTDMWQELKKETRPIVIYGMGNGADKLIKRLDSFGIKFADVFASDGFVRGHSFHGVRVKSFSEIKQTYPDFVILLSFATKRPEVLKMIAEYDEKYDLYAPDMPVSEEDIYFDSDFYNAHYSEISDAYNALEDDESKRIYISVIRYKLSGRIKFLLDAYTTQGDMYSLLPREKITSIIDVGAYNGDTLDEARRYFPNLKKATLIEPDPKTYKRLCKYVSTLSDIELKSYNAAAWDKTETGAFAVSGNRNSSVLEASTHSYEHTLADTSLLRIDDLGISSVDYIKYDVEGAEREALSGTEATIRKSHPTLLVSLYHKSRDLFELINLLKSQYPNYSFYLRRLLCLPAWEINLIMIPKT